MGAGASSRREEQQRDGPTSRNRSRFANLVVAAQSFDELDPEETPESPSSPAMARGAASTTRKKKKPAGLEMPFSPTSPSKDDGLLTPISPVDPSPERQPHEHQQLPKKRKKKKKKHGAKHGLAEDSELAEDPIRYNAAGRASSQEQVRAYKEYLAATRKGVRAESEKRAKPETRTSAAVDLVLQQKLFRAACQDDAETLRELFNAGASPDVRNANNESLLDLAKGRKRWRAHALIASQLSSRANDGGTEVLVLAGGADGSGPLSPVSPNANRGLLQKGPRKKSNVVDTPPSTSLPSHELTAETTRQPRRRRPSVNEAVNAGSLKLSKFGAQALLGSAIQKAVMQASGAENRHVTDGSIPKPRTTEVLNDPRGNHAQSKPRRRRPSVQETL